MSALTAPAATVRRAPHPRDVLELLKPVTWFPPIWAFLCGVVSSGVPVGDRLGFIVGGALLAGPLVCGTSQAVNDWFDRHVDAINEPNRPIPSGRIPGRWGLWIALAGTVISLAESALLGRWVLVAAMVGLVMAWAYSAPPVRTKTSGWWGPLTVALSYEGLSWFTGAAVMAGTLPRPEVLITLTLYALGAHGIMVLNDFKAVEGDIATGVRSLPATLGVRRAALIACATMAAPQLVVIGLLVHWGVLWSAGAVSLLLLIQFGLMRRLLTDPAKHTPWYAATGVSAYVLGMLASAFGLGALA
jgi:chlorophyll synthase